MTAYSISDAVEELTPILDRAPGGAARGEWIATTMQAGASRQSGGYEDKKGLHVPQDGAAAFRAVDKVIGKLEASQENPFNKLIVRWRRPNLPFMKGRVTVEMLFDEAIVPRGTDDPIYEAAAAARFVFWRAQGDLSNSFAAEKKDANAYNQTKWFGPHRRVLAVNTEEKLILATDGLSTPWAGVSERENGVGCELFIELESDISTSEQIDNWASLLISVADFVADGYRIAADVALHGAILFCRLTEDFSPMTRIILSRDDRQITGLPFGSVPLIRVTPIAEVEIEGWDLSDDGSARAANHVLEKRGYRI